MEMQIKPHANSDPQLPVDRSSSFVYDQPDRLMMSYSGDPSVGRTNYRTSTYGSVNDQPSCCVAGEHFLTSQNEEYLCRSLSMDSVVNVDISDMSGDLEARISLKKCQSLIHKPYTFLLALVGWRPWFKERFSRRSWCLSAFNCLYPLIVILFMLYHFAFQIISCQGKYDMNTCTKGHESPFLPEKGRTQISAVIHVHLDVSVAEQRISPTNQTSCCQHILPTYVVPAVMHFVAYGYGFLHFRIHECEQLYALMERVFLQAQSTPGVQKSLIRNTRFYLCAAVLWFAGQVTLEVLYYKTIGNNMMPLKDDHGNICLLETFSYEYLTELLPLKLIGIAFVHCVNVAIWLNYCTQCEMLLCCIKRICLSLHERSVQIKAAMHEILGVRESISMLNDSMGKMMACCIFNFAELTIIGTTVLILNKNYQNKLCIYRILFYVLIFGALLLPLIQAARLSRTGCKLRQISFEMRVFGYQNASQLELDSFVLFVNGATLRAKLFGVAIRTASIMFTFGASAFILLTLMVIDIFSVSGYKKIF